ncbi:MAG: cupin domain-containing protein [Leucobacter sp.]|nr:cupin domain-containing protein [Leucobacter sp.]
MEIIPAGNRDYVYGGRFTGTVQLEMIIEAATEELAEVPNLGAVDVARIHHEDGAVTHWHTHPGGQILTLVSGVGRVGSDEGTTTGIVPGTVIRTDPNERHWHGADAGSNCVWHSVVWGVTDWSDDNPLEGK